MTFINAHLSTEQKQSWEDNGYVLLKNFYSNKDIEQINQLVDQLWVEREGLGPEYVVDIFVGSDNEQRLRLAEAPADAREHPYKLNDLFLSQQKIRELVVGERLAPILGQLLNGFPMVCNSLNFEYGSQQAYHFDTFYMPSPTPNKMVASWIALEDTTEDNGPLTYFPGSHKIRPYLFSKGTTHIVYKELPAFEEYINKEIEQRGLKAETFLAEKGDVFIWHSQLFHGGSPIKDKSKTRKSLVTHYFTNEDFPKLNPTKVCEDGGYMNRKPQRVPGDEFPPITWLKRILKGN